MQSDRSGVVFDISTGAMNDGPGIRTTVFLKGCPLSCAWCHNPESQNYMPETGQKADGSTVTYGRYMRVSEIMKTVRRDLPFYQRSGGGVTFSGGEPLAQPAFLKALVEACYEEQIPVCLDTSGYGSRQVLGEIADKVDLFLFDYKQTGEAQHLRDTGVSSSLIRENLEFLDQKKKRVWLRCPIVPGYQDCEEHFAAIAALKKKHPCIERVDLMPFHILGRHKYRELGKSDPTLTVEAVTKEKEAEYKRRLEYYEKMGNEV